ncbi:hypothetical protein [Marinobacterium litorale]|uniref:hypothetical protein n=1 Tax=Marinobacterium litorale TaxID=404770 RepID=UPI00041BC304|nr:hypothetical protein [Marinobacterium litorale]
MLLTVRYPTKEKDPTKTTHQHLIREAQLQPVRIVRQPCGKGAASNRYTYIGVYVAPADAQYALDGMMREVIDRKANPHFKPKALYWDDDTATV